MGVVTGATWDRARWPHFSPAKIACRCCREIVIVETALDALERLRNSVGAPLVIVSAHRCARHNALVGGAPLSQHKRLAFDILLAGHDPAALLEAAQFSGFTGFGFGRSFLHLDTRAAPARWFYPRSKSQWTFLRF